MFVIWTMVTLEEAKKVPDDHDVVGPKANITDTPWIIAIVGLESFVGPAGAGHQDFDYAFCSGGLIHERYVLTAAHCYHNPNGVYLVAGLDVFDVVDRKMLNNETQVMTVDSWYNHPCYDKFTRPQFDIAVVRSNATFKLGPKTGLISLEGDEWPQHRMYNRECIAVFWELIYFRRSNEEQLHYVNVTAKHGDDACPCAMNFQQKRLICNDPLDVAHGCIGASGGLMVCNKKAVGVASHTRTLECLSFDGLRIRCHDPNSVVAWIYLCPILDWIREVASVANIPSQPTSCSAVHSRQQFMMIVISSCLWLIMRNST